jgi:hypothetical protein
MVLTRMRHLWLGIPVAVWAAILWIAVAGTFGVLMYFRALVGGSVREELLMSPEEARWTSHQLRLIDRFAAGFGLASVFFLLVVAGLWIFA